MADKQEQNKYITTKFEKENALVLMSKPFEKKDVNQVHFEPVPRRISKPQNINRRQVFGLSQVLPSSQLRASCYEATSDQKCCKTSPRQYRSGTV